MPREKILFKAEVSPVVFLPAVLMFILTIAMFIYGVSQSSGSVFLCLVVLLFVYSIWLGIQALIIMATTEFAITNRRIVAKRGFIRRHTLELLLSQIESVSVDQGILGRLLNFGTVTVTGTGGTSESFRAITSPLEVRRKVNHILEAYMRYRQNMVAKQVNG